MYVLKRIFNTFAFDQWTQVIVVSIIICLLFWGMNTAGKAIVLRLGPKPLEDTWIMWFHVSGKGLKGFVVVGVNSSLFYNEHLTVPEGFEPYPLRLGPECPEYVGPVVYNDLTREFCPINPSTKKMLDRCAIEKKRFQEKEIKSPYAMVKVNNSKLVYEKGVKNE